MSQLQSQKMKLDMMEKNFDDLINNVKHEIAFASKRDGQLVDRKHQLPSNADHFQGTR